jgi:hypothetical protein
MVGAVAGKQVLDGLGCLPVQVAVAVVGGQAATSAAEPLTVPSRWTTRTSGPVGYSAQVPRLLRAEVVGNRAAKRPRDRATPRRGRPTARPAGHPPSGPSQAGSGRT